MSIEHTVLVSAQEDDPQLSMLKGLRHIVGREPAAFSSAVKDPAVILAWSAPKKVLREVFLMCQDVRWVHSRSAGLDNVLFPELIASDVPLTNGRGVFSQSLGNSPWRRSFISPRTFAACCATRWRACGSNLMWRRLIPRPWALWLWGHWPRRCQAGAPHGHAGSGHQRHPPPGADPNVDQFYKPEDLTEMLGRCDYVVVRSRLRRRPTI